MIYSFRTIRYIVVLLFSMIIHHVGAQNRSFCINVRSDDGAMIGCVVVLPQLERWSVSDAEGKAMFENLPQGTWAVEGRLLGYVCQTKEIVVGETANADIFLVEENYQLEDVVVTAKTGAMVGTSSVIDRTALEHQQLVSVVGALQLLPGQLTQDIDMSSAAVMTVRDTKTSDATTALGTSILIDGANVINDANLQQMSTSSISAGDIPVGTGTGVDVRSISTDRIESIEVVRGVASAEYGNLTSGAVLVNTRAGVMPLTITVKTDPRLKSVSLGKGIKLNARGGAFNGDIDFANCKEDERNTTKKYRRATAQLAFSDNYSIGDSRLIINLKLNGHLSKNTDDSDPDMLVREYIRITDNNLSVNASARWVLNKPFLTSLRFVAYSSFGHQISEQLKTYVAKMPTPYTYSLQSGEHEGSYYPIDYDEIQRIDGKPINVQLKATALISHDCQDWGSTFTFGGEWNAKGNKGDGKTGQYLPTGYRPRSFADIPFIFDYSLFAEEHLRFKILSTWLDVQAGARFTGLMTDDYDFDINIDPRFNMSYSFIDKVATKLKLRAAWGVQTKLPTLAHLYPDPAYLDQISYTYVDNDYSKNKAIFTTLCLPYTNNYNIKLPRSTNYEFGINAQFGQIKSEVTFFNERLRNGFDFISDVEPFAYRIYDMTTEPAQYINGTLQLAEGELVNFYTDTTFMTYNRPTNVIRIDKMGVEYNVDLGKVKSINTQFVVDGAFFDVKRYNDKAEIYYISQIINGLNRKYAATSMSRSSSYNETHSRRLNTSIRIITRIPALRMVCTIKGQCVWKDWEKHDNVSNGRSLIEQANDGSYFVRPLSLVAFDGTIINNLPNDLLTNSQTMNYVKNIGANAILANNPKPYAMLDVRLTKEIGEQLQMSFYVNNFTNSRPKRYMASSDMNVIKNTEIYFGCDLKMKFK